MKTRLRDRRRGISSRLAVLATALLTGSTAAQQVWLPICPGQGVRQIPASRTFGGPLGPGLRQPSWVLWTPAHRRPAPTPGQYLRAVRELPVWIAWTSDAPRLFLRGPFQRRVLGTVTDAMPALCAAPLRR